LWALFHILKYLTFRFNQPYEPYFTKQYSVFYKPDAYGTSFVFKPWALYAPISRSLLNLAIQVVIATTFYYAQLANLNNGVAATIFSSAVVFSALLFYLFYGQKLSYSDTIGCLMIIGCVVLIGIGGLAKASDSSSDIDVEKKKEMEKYLVYTVLIALLTGFVFSVNTLNIKFLV